jgi:signal transduction histidine kinase
MPTNAMPATTLKILIADDDQADRKLIKRALKEAGLHCDVVETGSIEEAVEACKGSSFDCAFIDYRLPGEDGSAGVSSLHEGFPYMSLIMLTGQGDEVVATEAMKRGALDYIAKRNFQEQDVKRSVINAIEKAILQRKVAQQHDALEVFNRVLVHDLKAPLISIRSFAALIGEATHHGTLEEIAEYCRRIDRGVTRASALIDMLHQYSRADGRVAFEQVEICLVMDDTLANLDHTIQQRGARVTNTVLPTVYGNAPQLVQLLQNLIGNAIKYCSADTPCVHVSAQPQEENVWLLSVKDNGIGISQENFLRIFEPFQRLHGADQYEGTGLGLATCKKIVERHGGRIWCESEKGQGATFSFTLNGAK